MKKTSKNAAGIFFLLLALICMLSSASLTVFAEGNKDELTPQKLEELKKKYNDDKDEIDDDAFDPDAEITSLALTIPSWISTMKRAWRATDKSKTTAEARKRLSTELIRLRAQINNLLRNMKEK